MCHHIVVTLRTLITCVHHSIVTISMGDHMHVPSHSCDTTHDDHMHVSSQYCDTKHGDHMHVSSHYCDTKHGDHMHVSSQYCDTKLGGSHACVITVL
jgi:hypothetical protein